MHLIKVCAKKFPSSTENTAPEVPDMLCQWSHLCCDCLTSHYITISTIYKLYDCRSRNEPNWKLKDTTELTRDMLSVAGEIVECVR